MTKQLKMFTVYLFQKDIRWIWSVIIIVVAIGRGMAWIYNGFLAGINRAKNAVAVCWREVLSSIANICRAGTIRDFPLQNMDDQTPWWYDFLF